MSFPGYITNRVDLTGVLRFRRVSFTDLSTLLVEPLVLLGAFLVVAVPLHRGLVLVGVNGLWGGVVVELGAYVLLWRVKKALPVPRPSHSVGLYSKPDAYSEASDSERLALWQLGRASASIGGVLMWPFLYVAAWTFETVYGVWIAADGYGALLLAVAGACFLSCWWMGERIVCQYSPAMPEWWPRPLSDDATSSE